MLLEVERVSKRFGGRPQSRGQLRRRGRPGGRADRPQRCRQDHAVQRDRRVHAALVGLRSGSRVTRSRGKDPTGSAVKACVGRFQIVKPFRNLTVLENVVVGAFTRVRERRAAYEDALKIVEATGLRAGGTALAQALPIGLRKRVEVARALATRPRMILLDEVMNGLNPTELREMIDLIRRLNSSGLTVLLIEHVMAAVMDLCQRIVVVHHEERSPTEARKRSRAIHASSRPISAKTT